MTASVLKASAVMVLCARKVVVPVILTIVIVTPGVFNLRAVVDTTVSATQDTVEMDEHVKLWTHVSTTVVTSTQPVLQLSRVATPVPVMTATKEMASPAQMNW